MSAVRVRHALQLSAVEQEPCGTSGVGGGATRRRGAFEEMRQPLLSPPDIEAMRLHAVADAWRPPRESDRCDDHLGAASSLGHARGGAAAAARERGVAKRAREDGERAPRRDQAAGPRRSWRSRARAARARSSAPRRERAASLRGEPTDEVTGRPTAAEAPRLTARNELLEEIDAEPRREAERARCASSCCRRRRRATRRIRRPTASAAQTKSRASGRRRTCRTNSTRRRWRTTGCTSACCASRARARGRCAASSTARSMRW